MVAKPAPVTAETAKTSASDSVTATDTQQADPAPIVMPASQPVAPQQQASAAPQATTGDFDSRTALWIALAGLAVLAAGAAALMRRSRKERVETGAAVAAEPVVTRPVAPQPEPAFMAREPVAPTPTPVAQPAPVRAAAMPAFEPASYVSGRHERAAEAGPTADNPFLTRKNRLRRARFYDRQERLAAEAATTSDREHIAAREQAPAARPAVARRQRAVAPAPARPAFRWPNTGMKPAFSKG
ncbi:hypothetical protein GCM10023219_30150 [Stakelama sediminis]